MFTTFYLFYSSLRFTACFSITHTRHVCKLYFFESGSIFMNIFSQSGYNENEHKRQVFLTYPPLFMKGKLSLS